MYPLETDIKEFYTKKNLEEVKEYFENKICKKSISQITCDNKFYGKVHNNFAVFELGQFPTRNAWRPIIKLEWTELEENTKIISKYSLDKFVYLFFSVLPFFGLYISIEQKILIPFVITLIIYLILIFGLFQLIYMNSKKRTTKLLNELLSNL